MSFPFFIKICGVRTVADIEAVQAAGGDAVGINFFADSIRYVDANLASRLAAAATARGVLPIGLFVNEETTRVVERAAEVGLQWVQLHGDEPPAAAEQLAAAGLRVLRAVRLTPGPLETPVIEQQVQPWRAAGCAILLDGAPGTGYGGQGIALDWPAIRRWSETAAAGPFALAGGLQPENVARAIAASGAAAVDVASGVEAPRGRKSPDRIRTFCRNASGHPYR